jgi:hypothetical protein
MEETVRSQFNQILVSHYERLTGSINTVGGLPLNLDNIACLIIFGGRELEMSDIYSEISERYTMDEFLKEVKDAGIEAEEHFQTAMQDLIQRKYIEQRPDGHVHGYSETKETARILNNIFPKMQGLSLLAYIWQTIAEVTSGRTDLESALSRFDQTLQNHGVFPPKPKIPVITKEPEKPIVSEKKETGPSRRSSIIRNYVVSETSVSSIPSILKPVGPAPARHQTDADRNGGSSREQVSSTNRRENEEKPGVKVNEIDQNIQAETEAMKQKIAELESMIAAVEKEKQDAAPETAAPVKEEEPAEVENKEDIRGESVPIDDEVARKIAAFEKELALVCPICKTGILKEQSTAAGKIFYSCETEKCNFISWGRPHNIPCARCKNPFLVEVSDAAGQTILRCPRATCQHRQALNAGVGVGGGVKVVRKRLVRRPK